MRQQIAILPTTSSQRLRHQASGRRLQRSLIARRFLQIQATPSSPTIDIPQSSTLDISPPTDSSSPDARIEVLGPTSSLLSVSLSASQNLFTRRGTLIGVSGSPENAISTLSPLSPFRRAPLGVPFLYQRVASTTPLSLLIGIRTPNTSFTVLNLDGRSDWMVTQRNGLVAWTGQSLIVKPSLNTSMSLAHWGNSTLAGRGLVALAGSGNVYQVTLKTGEQYIAHPSNVLAYTTNPNPPQPYRFKSSILRFQLPDLTTILPNTTFIRNMRQTAVIRGLANFLFTIRTWTRTTIWGDRLFLRFHGPTTLLLQSRASPLPDVLTSRDINEIADSPAGAVQSATNPSWRRDSEQGRAATSVGGDAPFLPDQRELRLAGDGVASTEAPKDPARVTMSYASVNRDGKVRFGGP